MFEYLIYSAIGFVGTLLALEIGWHFTACSIHDETSFGLFFKYTHLIIDFFLFSNGVVVDVLI